MALVLGEGFTGGGMPLGMVESVLMRKTWAVSNGETGSTTLALFRGRVGLTEEGTGSVTLAFLNGGMGSIDGETELITNKKLIFDSIMR